MPAKTYIKHLNGSGAPTGGQVRTAELAIDTTNEKVYSSKDGSSVFEVGGAGAAMARVSGSTYFSIQHCQDIFHSSGWSSGGQISDGGAGAVNGAAGTGFIRATDSRVAEILFFDWDALNPIVTLTTGQTRWIGVEYNAGSPRLTHRSTPGAYDGNTEFELGVAHYDGTTVHIVFDPIAVGDHAGQMITRAAETMPRSRDNVTGGLILGESGDANRYVTVSAGALWERLNRFAISEIDTDPAGGADTFNRAYRDGAGGWTWETGQTAWPNTQIDDNSGALLTMTNNRYANCWFYLTLAGDLLMLYGQAQYTTEAAAEAEASPSTVPDRISYQGKLIGRIVFKKSTEPAEAVQSVFVETFSAAGVTDHGNMSGLGDDDHTQYLLADGTRALAGAWDMGSYALTNVNIDSGTVTGITDLAVADGGTGASDAATARTNLGTDNASNLSSGTLPAARLPSGAVVQVQTASYTTGSSGTTTIPFDDTTPQSSEGTEITTVTITPTDSSNTLLIEINANVAGSSTLALCAALFQDAGANALATAWSLNSGSDHMESITLRHTMTAGTTSATTFKFRFAGNAGTWHLNRRSTAHYNGTLETAVTVTEIQA